MAEAAAAETTQKAGKGRMMTVIVVAVVAGLEAVGFLVAMRFMGAAPQAAHGEDKPVIEKPQAPEPVTAELQLLKGFKVPNDKGPRPYIYDFDITIVTPADKPERLAEVKQTLETRSSEIQDRFGQIIRAASPRVLSEDDFHTLREQLQQALTDVLKNPDAIKRVLIPRCVPMRAG